MKITNEFTVGVPIERAWEVLTDLEGIAPCMPGAQLTGREGEVYQGKVKIKVGPVSSEYAGTASFAEKDETAHRAVIDAKGRDSRGAGNASALISAQLHDEGDRTRVNVDTDLKITGKIAQFGSGMISEVSQKLLGQFVTSLEAKLAAPEPAPEPDASTGENHDAPVDPAPGPPAEPAGPAAATHSAAVFARTPEPEAIDLLGASRGALIKRLAPLAAGALLVALVLMRRARRRR